MSHSLSGWSLLVNLVLPIPLILTLLLVLPLPRNARKGILLFTSKVLNFNVLGNVKLVNFALLGSGLPFVDSAFRTYKGGHGVDDPEVRPELKIGLLAKKWREERNFWITAMGFTMWCLMSVLYAQVGHMVAIEDEVEGLRDEVADLKGEPRPPRVGATRKAAGAVSSAVKDGLSTCATTVTPGGGVDTPGAATPESMGASTLTRRRV